MAAILEFSDAPARHDIEHNIDVCMLVEAGAGSGKTTSLIKRMLRYIKRGTRVESIAAVTFTRKAANELRERFQVALEVALLDSTITEKERENISIAIADLNRAFIGTIHSFCGRLLREYPLEVGLDPNFREVTDEDWDQLLLDFWNSYLERGAKNSDSNYGTLRDLNVNPRDLLDGFKIVVNNRDVVFESSPSGLPDSRACRDELNHLLDEIAPQIPKEMPIDGWDVLMSKLRLLISNRKRNPDWDSTVGFCSSLEMVLSSKTTIVQKRWGADKLSKEASKLALENFEDFARKSAEPLLESWRAYRYHPVMKFLEKGARQFEDLRKSTGQLSFNDLLWFCAQLLREHPKVRDEIGERFRYLLVDEFQDTDPLQAEICFLIGSPSSAGRVWQKVKPREGALFFVGDPKQSIYRFRRADIQIYDFARRKISECGSVVALTQNFRSTSTISEVVNKYFEKVFPETATEHQAAFSRMHTVKESDNSKILVYKSLVSSITGSGAFRSEEADIAAYIADRIQSGKNRPGDFMILPSTVKEIAEYARELSLRNIPVATTGAPLLQESELMELCVVLEAIADPENGIAVAAALEGSFIGCTPEDLFYAKKDGHAFTIIRAPQSRDCVVGRGLEMLNTWWRSSQRLSGDELLELIYADTGLLYYAATQDLGDGRAGVLMYIIETLRSTAGACSISVALEKLKGMLAKREADDTPLRAGQNDAVRVMNLHKAKGLEAKVVFLVGSSKRKVFEPSVIVMRNSDGNPRGFISTTSPRGIEIAHHQSWPELVNEESHFSKAEAQRLLYVAATRSEEELIVTVAFKDIRAKDAGSKENSRSTKDTKAARIDNLIDTNDDSPQDGLLLIDSFWSPLYPGLLESMDTLPLINTKPVGRAKPSISATEIRSEISAVEKKIQTASEKSFIKRTVSHSARENRDIEHALYTVPIASLAISQSRSSHDSRGPRWGSAVHRSIEGMGRGRSGLNLERFVLAVCAEEGLCTVEAEKLLQLLEEVRQSAEWKSLISSPQRRFELKVASFGYRKDIESHSSKHPEPSLLPELIEGVMDAAYQIGDQWQVIDWKTDSVSDEVWETREGMYKSQVSTYADILKRISGRESGSKLSRLR